jgi:hypothetical protein
VAVEGLERCLQSGGQREGVEAAGLAAALSGPLRNIGMSSPGMFSATGTRGNFTMPASMASMSEKSLMVHGKSVPSA